MTVPIANVTVLDVLLEKVTDGTAGIGATAARVVKLISVVGETPPALRARNSSV